MGAPAAARPADAPVVIVGGGVCGLALAHSLQARGIRWLLLEARPRLGGRVLARDLRGTAAGAGPAPSGGGTSVDLGAIWYWPATQPAITRLVADLGLASLAQPDDGQLQLLDDAAQPPRPMVYEPAQQRLLEPTAVAGAPMGHSGQPSLPGLPSLPQPGALHGGARRLAGGMGALVQALAAALPPQRLRLGCKASALVQVPGGVRLRVQPSGEADGASRLSDATGAPAQPGSTGLTGATARADDYELDARLVVLALPPRLVHEAFAFEPALPAELTAALRATPTWMATAAKAAVPCGRATWREPAVAGQGNAWVTHPQAVLAEVFDAGVPGAGATPALAGFSAMGAAQRQPFARAMPVLLESQVRMLFGPEAEPQAPLWQDWSTEAATCSATDRAEDAAGVTASAHGAADPRLAEPQWGGRLLLGGSETARSGAGYVEGALNAAARLRRQVGELLAASAPAEAA